MASQTQVNPITGSPDRSTGFSKLAQMESVKEMPLGAQGERNPNVAANAVPPKALYHARNVSSTVKRRVVKHFVNDSMDSYPQEVLDHYGIDRIELKKRCQTRDMNIYEEKAVPIRRGLVFNNRVTVVEPGPEGKPGEWKPIDEGIVDLYLGNWERMHSSDPKVRETEGLRIARKLDGKPVCFWEGQDRPPSAYIEIRREEITVAPVAADNANIFADQAIEI